MDNHPTALAAAIGLLLGGILSSIDDALSFVAVVTAVLTGTARYFAVLRGAEREQVEHATAYGFFLGGLLSALLLVLDRVLGG